MLRKIFYVCIIFLISSCTTTIKSASQFEYTGYIEERGFGITVKPPGWAWAVELYHFYFD